MIHYHGLPMTPAADMVKAFAGRHAMVSFEHPEGLRTAKLFSRTTYRIGAKYPLLRPGR